MKIKLLTLFPEMVEPVLSSSILGRASRAGLIDVDVVNIRDYSQNKHKNTDDYPFGGGAGMVMMPQPVVDAIEKNTEPGMRRIYMSPRGRRLDQHIVEELAGYDSLLLLCGHYEGVDQRALDLCIDEELSIGDYVLTGGELGALVVIDSVSRLIPGVLGSEDSSEDESFTTGLLEYPQYTRPADFRGMKVPDVLLGGNHRDITAWRREESLRITREKRPELLESAPLDDSDRQTLARMTEAERMIALLAESGIIAHRMEMFAEASFAREWFSRFVPAENRAAAKKQCFSGRRHIGYLYQAFEKGYIPDFEEPGAVAVSGRISGSAVLYLNRSGIALIIENAEAMTALPACSVLTSVDMTRTCAASLSGRLFYCAKPINS